MMAKAKYGRTISCNWVIVWTLVMSIGFMISLIKPQDAYADKKKISGNLNRSLKTECIFNKVGPLFNALIC